MSSLIISYVLLAKNLHFHLGDLFTPPLLHLYGQKLWSWSELVFPLKTILETENYFPWNTDCIYIFVKRLLLLPSLNLIADMNKRCADNSGLTLPGDSSCFACS